MPRNNSLYPPDEWLAAAFRVLSIQGTRALDAAPIAREIGADADEFRLHFESRQAFEGAMIARWAKASTDDIIAGLADPSATPRERIARLMKRVARERNSPESDISVDAVIRAWARHDPAIARLVKAVDERRFACVKNLLTECNVAEADRDLFATLICSAVAGFEALPVADAREREAALMTLVDLALKKA